MSGKPPGPRRAMSERECDRDRRPARPRSRPKGCQDRSQDVEELGLHAGRRSRSLADARSNARSLRSMVWVEPPGVVARMGPIGAEPRLTRGPTETPGAAVSNSSVDWGEADGPAAWRLRRNSAFESAGGLPIAGWWAQRKRAGDVGDQQGADRADGRDVCENWAGRERSWALGALHIHRDRRDPPGADCGAGVGAWGTTTVGFSTMRHQELSSPGECR